MVVGPCLIALRRLQRTARLAYADLPYPGHAWLYRRRPDYAGELNHAALIARLAAYDGLGAAHLRHRAARAVPRGVRVAAWHRGKRSTSSRARTKTVTRRVGWRMLRAGDHLTLCRKVMGRRCGEPLERIAAVEVTSVRREPLDAITAADVAAEGFPQMTPAQFVRFFCRTHRGCGPGTEANASSGATSTDRHRPENPTRVTRLLRGAQDSHGERL